MLFILKYGLYIHIDLQAPKVYPEKTLADYIDVVVSAMKKFESDHFRSRLIICVNRGSTFEEGEAIVNTAISLKEKMDPYLVGIDFCGNPSKGCFKNVEPLFVKARDAGFKITLHAGEIVNYPDNEEILAFKPDRLGHCALFSEEQVGKLKASRIPVEVCASSNKSTLGKHSYNDVPNIKWMKECSYPFSLCTDDTILFNNDATGERFEVAHAFEYKWQEVIDLERNTINYIFDEKSKDWLTSIMG